jgi:hypothetical protein
MHRLGVHVVAELKSKKFLDLNIHAATTSFCRAKILTPKMAGGEAFT